MKQITILLAFIFLWTSQIQSQIPGYQGKRFFAELGGSFFFNMGFPTALNKGPASFPFGAHTGHFTIKDRYSLSLHYVLSRKATFKLAYNHQAGGLLTQTTTQSLHSSGIDQHDLFYQLYMHDVNLGFNLYGSRNSNIAPLGFYWDLGLRLVFIDGVVADQRVEYADNRVDNRPYTDQLNPIPDEPLFFMLGIAAGWGYRTVIADRLILNFGIDATIFLQYPVAIVGLPSPFGGPSAGSELTSYQKSVIQSTQDRYLFSFHVGIGVLII